MRTSVPSGRTVMRGNWVLGPARMLTSPVVKPSAAAMASPDTSKAGRIARVASKVFIIISPRAPWWTHPPAAQPDYLYITTNALTWP